MRALLLVLFASPALFAQAPLPCPEARQVQCKRDSGGDYRCSPGMYEPLPFGREVHTAPSGATITTDDGRVIPLEELQFDTSGLNRLEQQYIREEHRRRQHGGRRTEIKTGDTRTGTVTHEVRISGIARRRFLEWVAADCQPPGQFLRYLPKSGAAPGTKTLVNPEFHRRLLGGSRPGKWTSGGEMDRRSREIWQGRGRRR